MFGEIAAGHRVRPVLPYGESVLPSLFDIKGISGDSGVIGTYVVVPNMSLVLPTNGIYLIGYNVRAHISMATSTTGYLIVKLYRSDTGAYIENSERFAIICDATGGSAFYARNYQNESAYTIPVAISSSCSITMYLKRDGAAADSDYTAADLQSDTNGRTSMNYTKIG